MHKALAAPAREANRRKWFEKRQKKETQNIRGSEKAQVGQAYYHRRLCCTLWTHYVKEEMIAWAKLDIFLLPPGAGSRTKNYQRVTSAAGRDMMMDEWPRNGAEMG